MPKYSQNFLTDFSVAEKIADEVASSDFDCLVEIGPGRGFLTKKLIAKTSKKIIAIEIDPLMLKHLKKNIPSQNLPQIINADFLKLDLKKNLPAVKICFVGNLPYACANAILQKVLNFERFDCAIFMFQKEVAERILAETGESKYGVLTLSVKIKSKPYKVLEVGKKCFNPIPKVDSAVVGFEKISKPFFTDKKQEQTFFKTIKASFAHRRKTVSNSLAKSLGIAKSDIIELLTELKIPPNARPQNLSLEQYIKLSKIVYLTMH